jgi:hypothetical protein
MLEASLPARESNEPSKEGPLSFVLFETTFTLVSPVSKGHPSLVSLVSGYEGDQCNFGKKILLKS